LLLDIDLGVGVNSFVDGIHLSVGANSVVLWRILFWLGVHMSDGRLVKVWLEFHLAWVFSGCVIRLSGVCTIRG